MSSYFDGKGNIRPELLGTESEDVAKTFLFPGQGKALNSAQLRRFYGDMKNLERKLDFRQQTGNETDPFLAVLPLVKMVKSKVAYASNPRNAKVPPSFADWLKKNIDAIETADDFKAFMLHFEAVVGFCYGLGMSNS